MIFGRVYALSAVCVSFLQIHWDWSPRVRPIFTHTILIRAFSRRDVHVTLFKVLFKSFLCSFDKYCIQGEDVLAFREQKAERYATGRKKCVGKMMSIQCKGVSIQQS
jgi:hypothetical protein